MLCACSCSFRCVFSFSTWLILAKGPSPSQLTWLHHGSIALHKGFLHGSKCCHFPGVLGGGGGTLSCFGVTSGIQARCSTLARFTTWLAAGSGPEWVDLVLLKFKSWSQVQPSAEDLFLCFWQHSGRFVHHLACWPPLLHCKKLRYKFSTKWGVNSMLQIAHHQMCGISTYDGGNISTLCCWDY